MRRTASYLGCAALLLLAAGCSDDGDDGSGSCDTDSDCSDGLFCNGAEVCNADGMCSPGTAPAVDDGVDCTMDFCDEGSNRVRNVPDNGVCDDGLFCTGSETCNPTLGCQEGTPPTDGVDCTDDFCDEENDRVVGTPNNANCDDGLFCNGRETCAPDGSGMVACRAGTPPEVIDDGVGCTNDFCDEDLDIVGNFVDDANCDDTLFCNGAETCDPLNDCQPGTAPSDGVECTDDICDEENDTFMAVANDANCDNGLFCDGTETCDAVNDCQLGTPPVVMDDGVPCTNDFCDEDNDMVVNMPDDANCDDGLFCNGAETCDPVNDCQNNPAPVINDGVGCTDDICDEVNDVVVNMAVDSNCDDGLFCNGAETCDPTNDCQNGPVPVIDDGVDCTDDVCDEDNDVVTNTANDGFCNDMDGCTADACDPVNDCQNDADLICVACGDTTVYDNGTYDSVSALPTASGPWATEGLIDDFTIGGDSSFCTIEFDFVVSSGSTQFQDAVISIYDLGGGGLAGLGDFNMATPVFTQAYSASDGTLVITDTGDDMSAIISGDVLRYEAIGTTGMLTAGNYGLHLTFPNATTDAGGWATAPPDAGTSACMTGWGPSQATPDNACGPLGPAYENGAFRLLGTTTQTFEFASAPMLDTVDLNTITDTLVTGAAMCNIDEFNVDVDIEHSWMSDLKVDITHVASGTSVSLLDDDVNDTGNTDLVGLYTWTDHPLSVGWDTIGGPEAPTSPGTTYLPDVGMLSDFIGIDVSSDWTLSVNDDANNDGGSLNAWRIYGICTPPPPPPRLAGTI